MKTNIILVSFLLLLNITAFVEVASAQEDETVKTTRLIPPSPTAASMAKFGDVPVSAYTGIPDISIPIYEVVNQDIKLPISLKYHAGGIRVDEDASWVGLGWALSCGGSITRTVRGGDDIAPSGPWGFPDCYLPTSIDGSNKYLQPTDQNQFNSDLGFLSQVLNGAADSEPDIFAFNFNGRSGKFILNKRANVSLPLTTTIISKQEVKIEANYNLATNNYQWIVTDENGMKYFFNTTETTVSHTGTASTEGVADQSALDGVPEEVVSTWYLDRILSPTGAEILLNYSSSYPVGRGTRRTVARSQIKQHVTDIIILNDCQFDMNSFMYTSTYLDVRNVYLKEIVFPNGKIDFVTSDREDIEPVPGGIPSYAKKLDQLVVSAGKTNAYQPIKRYDFTYSYFLSNPTSSYSGKRLKLLSVGENDGVISRPPYEFIYNDITLPEKDSKSIDHWGYFNNAPNHLVNETMYGDATTNGTLVPPVDLYINTSGVGWRHYAGANRDANPQVMGASMLSEIKYPAGGGSSFEFESNIYHLPRQHINETPRSIFLSKYGPDTQVQNYDSDTVTIELTNPTQVKLYAMMQCYGGNGISCLSPGDEYEYDIATIVSTAGTPAYSKTIGYTLNGNNQYEQTVVEILVDLPAGKYFFSVLSSANFWSTLTMEWALRDTIVVKNHPGGGMRVKKISTYDGLNHANDQIINYFYTRTFEGETNSTGLLMSQPSYEYRTLLEKDCTSPSGHVISIGKVKQIVRNSAPICPLSTAAQGNFVGYGIVTEERLNSGKTEFEYVNEPDIIATDENMPGVPGEANLGNGLLKRRTEYALLAGGTYRKIREVIKNYEPYDLRRTKVKAMKVPAYNMARRLGLGQRENVYYDNIRFYDIVSEWQRPDSESTSIYSPADGSLALGTIVEYRYDHPVHLQLRATKTWDSQGNLKTRTLKYPYDYPGNVVHSEMVTRNILSPVIETVDSIGGNHQQSIKTIYAIWPNNLILPSTVEVKTGTHSYETRLRNYSYSTIGRLLSQSKEGDVRLSYKWGYNDQYPLAEVSNAAESEFYYEGFEEGLHEGIVQENAKTGKRVFQSGFTVNFHVPNQRKYLLSYWYRTSTAGDWIYKEVIYTGASYTISDGHYIDEVRVFPEGALMKTYTYEPLIGMTSETDFSGKTIYYEYNTFNELHLIRDQESKILKRIDYQHRQPITQ